MTATSGPDKWFLDEGRIHIDWITQDFDHTWQHAQEASEFTGEPAHRIYARLVLYLAECFGGDRFGGERA